MKVYIEDLRFKAILGILKFERKQRQNIKVDISFIYNFDENEKDFIDYSKIVEFVEKKIKKKKFLLIEDAIIYLEKKLLKKFNISNISIKITKPDILSNCKVSVSNQI